MTRRIWVCSLMLVLFICSLFWPLLTRAYECVCNYAYCRPWLGTACSAEGGTCPEGFPYCYESTTFHPDDTNCPSWTNCKQQFPDGSVITVTCSSCPGNWGWTGYPPDSWSTACLSSCPGGGGTCYGWHTGTCNSAGCGVTQRSYYRYCTETGWETECNTPATNVSCLCAGGTNPNGLSAEMFNYPEASNDNRYWYYSVIKRTRYDSTINFDWNWAAPDTGDPGGAMVDPNRFMARWNGYINIPAAGTWTFTTKTDNVAKLTVNSSTIINTWGLPDVTYTVGDTGYLVGAIYVDFDGSTGGYNWVREHDFSDQAVMTLNDNVEQRNFICQCPECANDGVPPGTDDQYFCSNAQGCDSGCGYAQPPGYFARGNLSGSNMVTVAIPEYGGVEYMLYQVNVTRCDKDWLNCSTTTYSKTGSSGAKNSYLLDFGTGGPSDPWAKYSMAFYFEPLIVGYTKNRGEGVTGAISIPSAGSYPISIDYSDIKQCVSGDPCDTWVRSEAVLGLYYSGPATVYQLVPSAQMTACSCTSSCPAACGQSDGCGVGVCGTGDTGAPSQPTCTNLGTVGVGTTLKWSQDTTSRAEGYQYQIDTGTITDVVGINTTTASVSGYAAGSHTYKARSYNDTCEAIGVGPTYASSWSSPSCSFCRETLSCGGVYCGQSLDCSTCGTGDTGAPSVPTANNLGTVGSSTTLGWSKDTTSRAEGYQYQIDTGTITDVVGINTTTASVSGYAAGSHTYKARSYNDTCEAIGVGPTYASSWSNNASFCYETLACGPYCGQSLDCSTCGTGDTGPPGQVSIVSPGGATGTPVPYETPSLTLQWQNSEVGHTYTDIYNYETIRTNTGLGYTGTVSRDSSGVGVTMGVGETGIVYRWHVRAMNTTCSGFGVGTTSGSWSNEGFYCYEGELCPVGSRCGQARDCPGNGNCSNIDATVPEQVTILSPTGPSINNPTVYTDVINLNLSWNNNEVGHTYTDFYNYQVIKVGGSNPSNIGTTFYGVGSTVARTVASVGVSGTAGDIYEWKVRAGNNNCPPTIYGVDSDLGFYVLNRTPTTPSLTIVNGTGTTIAAEAYGVGQSGNQICDTRFSSRQVRFVVNAYDLDGGDNINEVQLNIGSSGWVRAVGLTGASPTYTASSGLTLYNTPTTSAAGSRRTVDFPVEMSTGFGTGIYDLTVNTVDKWGAARNNVDMNRDFKNWDCQVAVTAGNLYDSSDTNGAVCPNVGYSNLYVGTSFTSLVFDGPGADNPAMVVTPLNSFASGGTLTWGANYLPTFNADLDMVDPISGQRVVDLGNLGSGTTSCPGGMLTINNAALSAYSDSPSLRIDFSGIRYQDPWYQAVGAGLKGRSQVVCNVPGTCQFSPSCQPAMSVEGVGESDNGLVSAATIDDNSGCDFLGGDCQYGMPNDWYLEREVWGESYTYEYLYNKYFGGLGLGVTYPGGTTMSQIGGTGVVFVNGDFEIDTDNSLTNSEFLLVVVKGEITIDEGVNNVAGILMADGGITASGQSASQLVISGMLYSATGNINLTRGYTNKLDNNDSPAVTVNYRSSLIFNMPAGLVEVLSGWREGQ